MKGLLVLGHPMCPTATSNYKGLYRVQPFPNQTASAQMISLWERYVQHVEEKGHIGITSELSLDELFLLAKLSQECTDMHFEVIYFNHAKACPYLGCYYGIDVTGNGGYSILGEGLLHIPNKHQNDVFIEKVCAINTYFIPTLNQYGLFNTETHAKYFVSFLNDLSASYPGCIEYEHWKISHIWKLFNPQ